MKQLSEEQALSRLATTCSRSEHCISQVREKMYTWGLPPEMQDRIIDYLTTHQYIDEARYARIFIEDKMQFNGWGPRKVAQALYAKHIDKEVFQPILDEIDPQTFIEQLRPLLRQKQRSLTADNHFQRHAKLVRFALSRGYDMDTIRACIGETEEEYDD